MVLAAANKIEWRTTAEGIKIKRILHKAELEDVGNCWGKLRTVGESLEQAKLQSWGSFPVGQVPPWHVLSFGQQSLVFWGELCMLGEFYLCSLKLGNESLPLQPDKGVGTSGLNAGVPMASSWIPGNFQCPLEHLGTSNVPLDTWGLPMSSWIPGNFQCPLEFLGISKVPKWKGHKEWPN